MIPATALVHLINLIFVIAVVLHGEGRAYTCKYDNEFARQPAQALTPALLLIWTRHRDC
jgi:hypothetical protein